MGTFCRKDYPNTGSTQVWRAFLEVYFGGGSMVVTIAEAIPFGITFVPFLSLVGGFIVFYTPSQTTLAGVCTTSYEFNISGVG